MRRIASWGARSALAGVVCCAAAAATASCGGDDNQGTGGLDAGKDATTLDSSLADAAPRDSGVGDAGDAGTADSGDGSPGDAGDAAEALTDAQIVQILHTANQGEVTAGTYAETHAVTGTIVDIATMFVMMHGTADAELLATAGDAGISTAPSNTATSLQTQAAADQTALTAATGVAFDELYYADQLRTHRTVLAIIDNLLLPQVQSPTLKLQVVAAQSMVTMHIGQLVAIEQGDAGTFDAGDAAAFDAGDGAAH